MGYFSLLQVLRHKQLRDYFRMSLSKLDTNILLVRISENAAKILIRYVIACQGKVCPVDSWITKRQLQEEIVPIPFQKYTDSIYWALATMTSTGYGDIKATTTNDLEMIFAALVMVLGKISFGFVLGNVASIMTNMETFEERFYPVLSHMRGLEKGCQFFPVHVTSEQRVNERRNFRQPAELPTRRSLFRPDQRCDERRITFQRLRVTVHKDTLHKNKSGPVSRGRVYFL